MTTPRPSRVPPSYPRAWRARYGGELDELLDDTYGDGELPLRAQGSLWLAGSMQRLRAGGLAGRDAAPARRVRSGSLVVLCAWGLFVLGGAGFAKFVEHWSTVTPAMNRTVPSVAVDAVQVAATVASVALLAAVLVALPSFVALVRGRGWASVARPVLVALGACTFAGAALAAVVVWSHQSATPPLDDAAIWPYRVVGLGLVATLVAAVVASVGAVVAVAPRLELGARALRALGALAVALAACVTVAYAGMLTWWIAMALHAPWFLSGAAQRGNATASVQPAFVLAAGVLGVGVVAACWGAWCVLGALGSLADGRAQVATD